MRVALGLLLYFFNGFAALASLSMDSDPGIRIRTSGDEDPDHGWTIDPNG